MSALPALPAVVVDRSDGDRDLDGILALQQANLERNLAPADAAQDGFVTVVHSRAILAAMHALAPSIVAREGDRVVGYALTMPLECRALVPALAPMFALLGGLAFDGRPLLDHRCYVMGQICVDRAFRGRGLFDALYAEHRAQHADRFDVLVTDVATRNARSLRAHARVGFVELTRYTDDDDEWATIALDLRRAAPPG